jgi:integrase
VAKGRTAAERDEEAHHLEKQILDEIHGYGPQGQQRRGDRKFAEIAEECLIVQRRRGARFERRLQRLILAMGDIKAAEVTQALVDRLPHLLVNDSIAPRPILKASTIRVEVMTPLSIVLKFGARRGWCDPPLFEAVRQDRREEMQILLPEAAERLIAAGTRDFKPFATVLFCTGARLGELQKLQWKDVHLSEPGEPPHVVFQPWSTKGGKRRVVSLPPRAVATLASLPDPRDPFQPVFLHGLETRRRWSPCGTSIRHAFRDACERAGLDPALYHPHSARHSWASWWHALWPNPMALKHEGGWSSVALVEVYAHLMPPGQKAAIAGFWGLPAVPEAGAVPGQLRAESRGLDTIWTPVSGNTAESLG